MHFDFNKIDKEYSLQDTRFIFIDNCLYWKQFSKIEIFWKIKDIEEKAFSLNCLFSYKKI